MKSIPAVAAAAFIALIGDHSFAAESKFAKIKIINSNRQEATLSETPNGVLIRLNLRPKPDGISPGPHAIHIHDVGKCAPPFKSAGEHFNPFNKKHGF